MDLLILIVTYNGGGRLKENLDRMFTQDGMDSALVVIIDNASRDNSADIARQSLVGRQGLLIEFSRNRGVAVAYNRGMQEAQYRGIEWMMILDQDTGMEKELIPRLMAVARGLVNRGKAVAGVCPVVVNGFFPDHFLPPYCLKRHLLTAMDLTVCGQELVSVDSTITSGTVYQIRALEDVGGFKEDYFIDFVDHECHMRLKRRGWGLWCDTKSQIFHFLGDRQRMTDQGIWVEHAPFRYVYMARNMLEGYHRLYGVPGAISFLSQLIVHAFGVLRHAQKPWPILTAMMRGMAVSLWKIFIRKSRQP